MIFGTEIRRIRESKGMLLRELAAALEVDAATISKIEKLERTISGYFDYIENIVENIDHVLDIKNISTDKELNHDS